MKGSELRALSGGVPRRRRGRGGRRVIAVFTALAALLAGPALFAGVQDGLEDVVMSPRIGVTVVNLYNDHCAACHDHPVGQMPSRAVLGMMTREAIYEALTTGKMQLQAQSLTNHEKSLLAASLPQEPPLPEPDMAANRCSRSAASPPDASAWSAWGVDPENSRFQPRPGFSAAQAPRLKPKWVFAYPGGSVSSLPIVVGGTVYSASMRGDVFALDAASGCTRWSGKVKGGVRAAPVFGQAGARPAIFVTDNAGFVEALDARTGAALWSSPLGADRGASTSGSPVYYQGRVYAPFGAVGIGASGADADCCTSRGGLAAFDAASGTRLWLSHTIAEPAHPTRVTAAGRQLQGPAGAAVWSAPTIDPKRRRIYVGTGNDYAAPGSDASDAIIAYDLDSGERIWVNQVAKGDIWQVGCQEHPGPNCAAPQGQDTDFGMPPILVRLGGGRDMLVAGSKNGVVYAFDPDAKGKLLWQRRLTHGGALGGLIFGAAVADGTVYMPVSSGLADTDQTGGLAALRLADGSVAWWSPPKPVRCGWGRNVCSPAYSAAVAAVPGLIFSGAADGHIRAFAMRDGALLWDFDVGRVFPAVNGVTAQGGAIGRGGQTIAGGMLYLNAGGGYSRSNALIAFSVDGR